MSVKRLEARVQKARRRLERIAVRCVMGGRPEPELRHRLSEVIERDRALVVAGPPPDPASPTHARAAAVPVCGENDGIEDAEILVPAAPRAPCKRTTPRLLPS